MQDFPSLMLSDYQSQLIGVDKNSHHNKKIDRIDKVI